MPEKEREPSAGFVYQDALPEPALAHIVERFWTLKSPPNEKRTVIILPDGRVDLLLSRSEHEPFDVRLMGLGTMPDRAELDGGTVMMGVSFKLPAIEYCLRTPVADILDGSRLFKGGSLQFVAGDLEDFEGFCAKATTQIRCLIDGVQIDPRKQRLFELLYTYAGALSVHELADRTGWSSRQINRYFTAHFGLSLKTYCSILRFRASFDHIKEGKLFPEMEFVEQPHFIREVRKLSGVKPGDLFKNQHDRFIQFSTLTVK